MCTSAAAIVAPAAPVPPAKGRKSERSAGKDTTTGHWELCGLQIDHAFPTFPQGFPAAMIERCVTGTLALLRDTRDAADKDRAPARPWLREVTTRAPPRR